jgi:hypothetical protein
MLNLRHTFRSGGYAFDLTQKVLPSCGTTCSQIGTKANECLYHMSSTP